MAKKPVKKLAPRKRAAIRTKPLALASVRETAVTTTPEVVADPTPSAIVTARAPRRSTTTIGPRTRPAPLPTGAIVVANKDGVTEAGKRMNMPRTAAETAAAPPKSTRPDCYIRLPNLIDESLAKEWARKAAYQLGTVVQVCRTEEVDGVRKSVVVHRFDRANDEDTRMLLKQYECIRVRGTPWVPDAIGGNAGGGFEQRFTPPPGAQPRPLITPLVSPPAPAGRARRSTSAPVAAATQAASNGATRGARAGGTGARVVELLKRAKGATKTEIRAVTGWGFGDSYIQKLAVSHKCNMTKPTAESYKFTPLR